MNITFKQDIRTFSFQEGRSIFNFGLSVQQLEDLFNFLFDSIEKTDENMALDFPGLIFEAGWNKESNSRECLLKSYTSYNCYAVLLNEEDIAKTCHLLDEYFQETDHA